jgi:hypothetical protein
LPNNFRVIFRRVSNIYDINLDVRNEILDAPITASEIESVIAKLQNNKAAGVDNETVIQCALKFTTCFIKLVTINIVLEQIINFSSFVKILSAKNLLIVLSRTTD